MLKKLILIALVAFPSISIACAEHAATAKANAFAKIDVISAPKKGNSSVKIRLSENKTGKPLATDDLKQVHTQQIHIMLVDPTLTDYKHIHPVETKTKGVYQFNVSPSKSGYYRGFADITPLATDKQEYVQFILGRENKMKPQIDTTSSYETEQNGLKFKLEFEDELVANEAVQGKITITKDGEEFSKLEKIMGSYAHIVTFQHGGYKTIHLHPIGDTPADLTFHFTPAKGFNKIFAQVKIGGKDIYAPFRINTK